jgi:hypothetical protein
MKYFVLILIVLNIALQGNAQFGMPSFRDVAHAFFASYTHNSNESIIRFYRKKDGWHVCKDRYANPENYFDDTLFWSSAKQSYLQLSFPVFTGTSTEIEDKVQAYLISINFDYDEYQFERTVYYGYPGWDWDIIQESNNFKNKGDTLLESCARAFSNYAAGFITDQFGKPFLNNDPDRKPVNPKSPTSNSKKEKFVRYYLKAIDAYSKLSIQNPAYETRVGNIKIKLANEYMFMYTELLMSADMIKARQYAAKASYNDSLLNMGKQFLDSVPLNSILITGGDNDTYPLWYLQEIKEYRTDVLVLNYNMLGAKRYLLAMNQKSSTPLFKVKDTTFLRANFDYFLFANSTDNQQKIPLSTFLDDIATQNNPFGKIDVLYENETLRSYYSKQIFFQKSEHSARIFFPVGRFLLRADFMLLDLLLTNQNRSIYSTTFIPLLSNVLELTDKGLYRIAL